MQKVSILIAVFNAVGTLDKCLKSCAEQSYLNKEIIIIDGGSTDGTIAVVKKWNLKLAYWESRRDNGVYHAWNKALTHSSGDWICFIGADDYWAYPQAISDLINAGIEKNVELVSGKVAIIDEKHIIKRHFGSPWVWDKIKRHHCIAHPGSLHHRSCFERNGWYNDEYQIAGDYDFSLRLGEFTRAAFIDRVFVNMGDSGLSHKQIGKTLLEVRLIQSKNPHIGSFKAIVNYCVSSVVININRLIGRL